MEKIKQLATKYALLSVVIILVVSINFDFSSIKKDRSTDSLVNNFSIINYDINYDLGINSSNESTLFTTEKITVKFIKPNVNHGIERYIPKSFNYHETGLYINSVTDNKNLPLSYETYTSKNNLVIRIGNPDIYVSGEITYVIKYSQSNVTRYYADSKNDEWYWDTNGTGWAVPIQKLNVKIKFSDSIKNKHTGSKRCFQGLENSTNQCDVYFNKDEYRVTADNLKPYENISVSFGFSPNTFKNIELSLLDKYINLDILLNFILLFFGVAITTLGYIFLRRINNRTSERKTIVTEYLPPEGYSVTVAADVINKNDRVIAAQILDLVIRKYIKLYEIKSTGFFGSRDYKLEIINNLESLKQEEIELVKDLFSGIPKIGEQVSIKTISRSSSIVRSLSDNNKKTRKLLLENYGVRAKDPFKSSVYKKLGIILIVLGLPLINIPLITSGILYIIFSFKVNPLTDKGLQLARYLDGLKNYIEIAEKERINMLQSPSGVEKIGIINTDDKTELIKLYEKVLPYSVLFGLEESWSKNIGEFYENTNTSPIWYSGSLPEFTFDSFSDSIGRFNSITTYGASSKSSSFSSGGFSGGGGGGGGGGGW